MIGSVARRRHYYMLAVGHYETPPAHKATPRFGITPTRAIFASMAAGHVVIRVTDRLGGGEPLRTAYAVA